MKMLLAKEAPAPAGETKVKKMLLASEALKHPGTYDWYNHGAHEAGYKLLVKEDGRAHWMDYRGGKFVARTNPAPVHTLAEYHKFVRVGSSRSKVLLLLEPKS